MENTKVFNVLVLLFILSIFYTCKPVTTMALRSSDTSTLKNHDWKNTTIPFYTWEEGTTFGDGLHIDNRYDPKAVTIEGEELHFHVDPMYPHQGKHKGGKYNFRSEIRTTPWPIKHAAGTEQWIGWRYRFSDDYVIDMTSPFTIYQNHNGVEGLSPAFELEIAAENWPPPAKGGEIQMVNAANGDRIILDVCPKAGTTIDIVVQVVYGNASNGLLKLWIDGELKYFREAATVYEGYEWGGNNKWGIYHHTFWDGDSSVQASLDMGAGVVDIYMGNLKILTRTPDHPEYKLMAFDLVKPQ